MADQNTQTNPDALEQLMIDTATRLQEKKDAEAKVAKGQGVTIEQIGDLLAGLMSKVDEKISKAMAKPEVEDEELPVSKSVGRKSTVTSTPVAKGSRDENPLQYIVSKARSASDAHTNFDPTDKALIWALTSKALSNGMRDTDTDEETEIDFSNL
jgi:hypothetical protein